MYLPKKKARYSTITTTAGQGYLHDYLLFISRAWGFGKVRFSVIVYRVSIQILVVEDTVCSYTQGGLHNIIICVVVV